MPYRKHIFICTNDRGLNLPLQSCRGDNLRAEFHRVLKEKGIPNTEVRANKSGCFDTCELGPTVVVYPDAVWYGRVTEEDVREIVESHIIDGKPVERLMLSRAEFDAARASRAPEKK